MQWLKGDNFNSVSFTHFIFYQSYLPWLVWQCMTTYIPCYNLLVIGNNLILKCSRHRSTDVHIVSAGNIVEAFEFLDGYSDGEGTDFHDSGMSTPIPVRGTRVDLLIYTLFKHTIDMFYFGNVFRGCLLILHGINM